MSSLRPFEHFRTRRIIPPCWWPATGRSPGAGAPASPWKSPSCWSSWPGLAAETLRINPKTQADAAGSAGKNISSANTARAHIMGRNNPESSTLKHVETHHHDPLTNQFQSNQHRTMKNMIGRLSVLGAAACARFSRRLLARAKPPPTRLSKSPLAKRRMARRLKSTLCTTPKAPKPAS